MSSTPLPAALEKTLRLLTNPMTRALMVQMYTEYLHAISGVSHCILRQDEAYWEDKYPELAFVLKAVDAAYNQFEDQVEEKGITFKSLLEELMPNMIPLIKSAQKVNALRLNQP